MGTFIIPILYPGNWGLTLEASSKITLLVGEPEFKPRLLTAVQFFKKKNFFLIIQTVYLGSFLVELSSMWDVSSPNRDWTQALCIGSAEP